MSRDAIIKRNNVVVLGTGDVVLMLAHGFGCDQRMWRFVLDTLVTQYKVVLFDYVGSGKSELTSFSISRYSSLEGYAEDVIDIMDALELQNVVFVGHSVSSMIGVIAAARAPGRIAEMIMICPSPCFLNHPPDYEGGFEREDLEELINLMDKNYIGWVEYLAPLVAGAHASPELRGELSGSFCSTDPIVAKTFAKATFFSDHRAMLPECNVPTLILQSERDALAAVSVGQYIRDNIPDSELEVISSEGHCLHMTDPVPTTRSIQKFVTRPA